MLMIFKFLLFLFLINPSPVCGDLLDQTELFLSRNVSEGSVNYEAIAANPSELNRLLDRYNQMDLSTVSGEKKKALYINAYNIAVIAGIIKHYPVEGPMAIEGFFTDEKHSLFGKEISLNELEKQLLYKEFPDERLHFVLVCAAKGCPLLQTKAYRAEVLEQQLEERTRATLNDPEFIRVNGADVEVSEIFSWYAEDFGDLVRYINRYREVPLLRDSKPRFYTYNWALNQ